MIFVQLYISLYSKNSNRRNREMHLVRIQSRNESQDQEDNIHPDDIKSRRKNCSCRGVNGGQRPLKSSRESGERKVRYGSPKIRKSVTAIF